MKKSGTFDAIDKLLSDLEQGGEMLGRSEARFLVDAYYIIQEDRKRSGNQERALKESEEPHEIISWFFKMNKNLEEYLKTALDLYGDSDPLGRWSKSIIGIGPVLSAGLLAHIDLDRAPVASSIYKYAGLDPTQEWKKGQVRPWNASLKTLCHKIGQSFVWVSGNEESFYGQVYRQRKSFETAMNEQLKYSDQAEAKLAKFNFDKSTEAYKAYSKGMLPKAHIQERALRYATKMFLSHYHEQGLRFKGQTPPKPWVIEHGGHAHYVPAEMANSVGLRMLKPVCLR